MTVSIPLLTLMVIVVYVAYRHMGLKVWHAVACLILGFLLASTGLACLLWGLQGVAQPDDVDTQTIALVAAGLISSWLAIRHLKAAPTPLLDLSTFRIHTFAISTLSAGTYFRISINATPFLLPLLAMEIIVTSVNVAATVRTSSMRAKPLGARSWTSCITCSGPFARFAMTIFAVAGNRSAS